MCTRSKFIKKKTRKIRPNETNYHTFQQISLLLYKINKCTTRKDLNTLQNAFTTLFIRYIIIYFRHIVNAFLLTYQLGTCCVYVVFVSENLHFVLHKQFQVEITEFQVMLAILIPLILINCIRDLKYLAPFTAIANVLTIVSFAIILYYIFRETPTLEGKAPVGYYADFPLFFGTVLFALEAIGVVSIFYYFFITLTKYFYIDVYKYFLKYRKYI